LVVGTCRIVLSLPGNDSLKGKRKVVRSILDRLKHRFNVAAAEVDDLDAHRRAVLGLAVVSNDVSHVHSMLDTLTSAIANASEALVIDRRVEIVHVGEGDAMDEDDRDFADFDPER
jgi:uncharacterized protein YlxP (DUF503 family)